MPKVTFIDPERGAMPVEALEGLSVMEAGRRAGVDIEGRCEGSLACSTCHVLVDPDWFERVGEPSLDEQDMLDLVTVGLSPTSRLCCQIIAAPELDGLVVALPAKRIC
jgi:2Fe-2S ferredoxin